MTRPTARSGARRDIPWAELDAASLAPKARARVGESWSARMRQEHLAVGAFGLLTSELAEQGTDSVVLGLIAKAASDELHHAEVCRRLARGLLGAAAVPRRLKGVRHVPAHAGASPRERVLLHVVELCCLSETLTGIYLSEMLARARDPAVRAALDALLEDEIEHARVGWAYLSSAGPLRRGAALADALPDMIERTMGWVIERSRAEPERDDPALEAFGYLGNDTGSALATRALTHVILPGFESLEVELGPTRRRMAERGWLPHAQRQRGRAGAKERGMATIKVKGQGTRQKPWVLKTPPGQSEFEAFRDEELDPPALVVKVGKTELRYQLRCIDDLHAMLKEHGDWMPLGSADEQKPAAAGTVEAWGRSPKNPVKGWYGIKKGLRGRFANYVPPVLEALGLAEVEHQPKNNRMRAV